VITVQRWPEWLGMISTSNVRCLPLKGKSPQPMTCLRIEDQAVAQR
jgi:hypothetical protein